MNSNYYTNTQSNQKTNNVEVIRDFKFLSITFKSLTESVFSVAIESLRRSW